jgi:hypothetical protein
MLPVTPQGLTSLSELDISKAVSPAPFSGIIEIPEDENRIPHSCWIYYQQQKGNQTL